MSKKWERMKFMVGNPNTASAIKREVLRALKILDPDWKYIPPKKIKWILEA